MAGAFQSSAFDEVAKQRILQESVKRELRIPQAQNQFQLNPYRLQLVTRKIGHEPEVTDADIANFREMEDAMAEHSKLPQDKKENAASGLPRTATQEYGWWYKEAGEYAEAVKPKKSCAETRFAGEYFRLKHTALHKERSGSLRTGGAKSAR